MALMIQASKQEFIKQEIEKERLDINEFIENETSDLNSSIKNMLNYVDTSFKDGVCIILHKPHPRKERLAYQIKQIIETLSEEGLI